MESRRLFRTVESPERLVHKVVDQFEKLIITGELAPSTRLPSEREFGEQLGVSRTVVREAVHILVAKGLLESRQGFGTIVHEVTRDRVTEPLGWYLQSNGATTQHLHDVRLILELESARLAAIQATLDEIDNLRDILKRIETSRDDVVRMVAGDEEFHRAVAATSHNPLMVVLLDSIRDLMREVRLQVQRYPVVYATIVPDHQQIVDAIQARDSAAACLAMQQHLDHALLFQREFLSTGALAGADLVTPGAGEETFRPA